MTDMSATGVARRRGGHAVILKVQRPSIDEQVGRDLELIRRLTRRMEPWPGRGLPRRRAGQWFRRRRRRGTRLHHRGP